MKTTPKILLPCLLLSAALTHQVSGLTFNGDIVGTTTRYSVPGNDYEDYFPIGSQWFSSYSYDSPTIDGVFTPASGNLVCSPFFYGFRGGDPQDDEFYPNGPKLTVVGGKVTAFSFFFIDADSRVDERTWDYDGIVHGTTSITDPTSSRIPDTGHAFTLFLLGSVILFGTIPELRRDSVGSCSVKSSLAMERSIREGRF